MPLQTALTERLSIRHPLLLAPMDLVADARLTAAVSAAGGLGLLGGGYGEAAWLERELAALAKLGQRFGVGFITWSLAKQPALLDRALERGPVAVMLSFGDPHDFVPRIHRANAVAICQVQSVAMAQQAVDAGADFLIAQGTEAGGHGAARGLFTLLPELVDRFGSQVPVIAAGGIADGRGLAAAMVLGACGAMVGTRFYASDEAAGAAAAKQRIVAADGDASVRSIVFDISRRNVWPTPFNGRCLRNEQTQRWLGREVELMQRADEESKRYLEARTAGNFDIAAVIAGESAGLIHGIEPAARIVERLVAQAEALGAGRAPG
jgi:nitronate monooxygenase